MSADEIVKMVHEIEIEIKTFNLMWKFCINKWSEQKEIYRNSNLIYCF